jgi:hypothetical protein
MDVDDQPEMMTLTPGSTVQQGRTAGPAFRSQPIDVKGCKGADISLEGELRRAELILVPAQPGLGYLHGIQHSEGK